MNKLTTKNAVKVSINKTTKQIRFTQQYFKNITEGEVTLGTAKNFIILNKNRLDKMIAEGYTFVDSVTKSTQNITQPSQTVETVDLTGNPETEEAIRKYYIQKKQRQGVHFVKGLHSINEKSYVSAREVFGESVFPKQPEIKMDSAFKRFHKSEIGRERQLENDRMEAR